MYGSEDAVEQYIKNGEALLRSVQNKNALHYTGEQSEAAKTPATPEEPTPQSDSPSE